MPWGLAAAAVSAGGAAYSSSQGAKGQQNAAQNAANMQQQQYDTTRSDNMPALEARNAGLTQIQSAINSFGSGQPTAAQVMAQPGYQFGLDQGTSALQNGAAAGSGIYSGAVGQALAKYGNDYGTSKYQQSFDNMQTGENNQINRLSTLANGGQAGAQQISNVGQQTANNMGQIGMSNATNQAAAGNAQANLWGGLAGQVGAWGKDKYGSPSGWRGPSSSGMGAGSADAAGDGLGFADGGAVRMEPRIGSRSPLPGGGTGGGLSNNAILMLLRQGMPQPGPQPVQMPGAPLQVGQGMGAAINPAAVLRARLQAAGAEDPVQPPAYAMGGAVRGPGGPQDDAIPVPMDGGGVGHLSNHEHVFTADAVAGAGNGDVEHGHMVLNKLMQLLQQKKAVHV